ncbi:MAG TPA: hypothetical protein VM656_11200 [Pyrinomonadaceae bacterium]|nr:hypothetical protein [Pyrinomonadaceae bacterium]
MTWTVKLLLAAAVWQQPQRLTSEQYLQLLPLVIGASERDARASAQTGSATGPLMLHTVSLTAPRGVSSIAQVPLAEVRRVLPPRAQFVASGTEDCDPPGNPSCRVRNHGVLVRLDSVVEQRDGVRAFLTSTTTLRRSGSATCHRELMLGLKSSQGRWVISDSLVWRMC